MNNKTSVRIALKHLNNLDLSSITQEQTERINHIKMQLKIFFDELRY